MGKDQLPPGRGDLLPGGRFSVAALSPEHRQRLPAYGQFLPLRGEWRLDLDALGAAVGARTRAFFLMNPSMPTGAVLTAAEWSEVARLCRDRDCWLIYNAAMERILFDGRPVIHPAALPGMAERTLIAGSVSKEYRMIGWRVGWLAGPRSLMGDAALVHIYNVVSPPGIAQAGACAALAAPDEELAACVGEWQRRRDTVVAQLAGLPLIPAAGGWSLLVDMGEVGYEAREACHLLLERGRVAATPMDGWGERNGSRFVRLVFSNEPVERLVTLRERVRKALPACGTALSGDGISNTV